MFNILLQAKKALTKIRLFARIISRSLSITVSTSGFHPDNAGSTPAEVTIPELEPEEGSFLLFITE